MTGYEFYDKVDAHPDLKIVGARHDSDEQKMILVHHPPSKAWWDVDSRDIEKEDWKRMEEILTGRIGPLILRHLTRIVGYYSFTNNWNLSKLGELDDRRRGNYAIPESGGE